MLLLVAVIRRFPFARVARFSKVVRLGNWKIVWMAGVEESAWVIVRSAAEKKSIMILWDCILQGNSLKS